MKKTLGLWVLVFILLNLYVNLVPRLFQEDSILLWGTYWLSFFCVAFVLGRYVLKLRGLRSFGMHLHEGWLQNLAVGFLIGSGVYAVKYLLCYGFGMFDTAGIMDASFIATLLAQALLAMFFSSAINDIMIRGYWLPYLRKEHLMKWYLLISSLLYILDDSWNEGFQVENMVFSAILGVTFAYTVLKTGSIWMSVGLHWGGNVLYRMMYGFNGQGVWRLESIHNGPLFDYISLAVTALMFPVVYLIIMNRLVCVDEPVEVKEVPLAAKLS